MRLQVGNAVGELVPATLRKGLSAERFRPFIRRMDFGDRVAASLAKLAEDLEAHLGASPGKWNESELVYAQRVRPGELPLEVDPASFAPGRHQLVDGAMMVRCRRIAKMSGVSHSTPVNFPAPDQAREQEGQWPSALLPRPLQTRLFRFLVDSSQGTLDDHCPADELGCDAVVCGVDALPDGTISIYCLVSSEWILTSSWKFRLNRSSQATTTVSLGLPRSSIRSTRAAT